MAQVDWTILNVMGGPDFQRSLDRHIAWGLKWLDLKEQIFGKGILALTDADARRANEMIRARQLNVYCFSTVLFEDDIEMGEAAFAATVEGKIERAIALAAIIKPRLIRLLASRTSLRAELPDAIDHIRNRCPWLIDLYRTAIDRLVAAGQTVTIENECHDCILASPEEVRRFYELLDRPGKVGFTWDVQNMWQMGTFPTTDAYQMLRDLMNYYHIKGGQHVPPSRDLVYRTALADASFPVRQITEHVIEDGVSPVICLNPPHGAAKPGYDESNLTERDLRFLRDLSAGA